MNLGIVFTNKCNAKCSHCSTSCGPDKRETLGLDRVKRLMTEAAEFGSGESFCYSITGGEPFLFFEQLVEMVKTGTAVGAKMTCVTNGYWATDVVRAMKKVETLKAAGLKAIAISTSEYHQQFVPLDRVRNAANAAIEAGLDVIIKYPYTRQSLLPTELAALLGPELANKVTINAFSVMPTVRTGFELSPEAIVGSPGIPEGQCPSAVVTVREDGQAYTCCIPGGFVEPLRLGNIETDSLACIYERFEGGDLQQILFSEGPAFIARKAIAKGLGHQLEATYSDVCHLCTDILAKPDLRALALKSAEEYQLARLSNVAQRLTQELESVEV